MLKMFGMFGRVVKLFRCWYRVSCPKLTSRSWKKMSERMKGLLGRSAQEFPSGRGLWLEPSQGIHTIGMSFPIDAAYLDARGRVLKTYHQLSPFRVAAVMFRARSVLELPIGTLIRTGTEVGDLLEIRPTTV